MPRLPAGGTKVAPMKRHPRIRTACITLLWIILTALVVWAWHIETKLAVLIDEIRELRAPYVIDGD